MNIRILSSESLGVRGLCCLVEMEDRTVLFDPGMSMGYRRGGFLPHPVQVAAGERIRADIVRTVHRATDVIISHFHGDHMPLVKANPYQLSAKSVREAMRFVRLWTKGLSDTSERIRQRVCSLSEFLEREFPVVTGEKWGPFTFSQPVPHGKPDGSQSCVMMTRVEENGEVFVHASDIQLLNDAAVEQILMWKPTTVLAAGPPFYLDLPSLDPDEIRDRTLKLSRGVQTLIIDHHLLRDVKGFSWLHRLQQKTENSIMCAADFMGLPRQLLEARRAELYEQHPVPEGWHENYANGRLEIRSGD